MSTLPARILKEALDDCKLTIGDLYNYLPEGEYAKEQFNGLRKLIPIAKVSRHPFHGQDFRFCHLLLKNFRKFGNLPLNTYYGLQFEKTFRNKSEELIDFLILLGDNGIGKSSLVDSLEYMFTDNIGEAKIRQIPSATYIRNKSGEKLVKVYMNNNENIVLGDNTNLYFRQEYDVSNFFFSENSILKFAEYTQRNRDNSNDWFTFFCYILGLGTLYDACSKDGILDQIKEQIIERKNDLASEDVNQIRTKLQKLIKDGCLGITDKQRTAFTQLQKKMLNAQEYIKLGKIGDTKEALSIFVKPDFYSLTSFYFIQDFQNIYAEIISQMSFESYSRGLPFKKVIFEGKKENLGNTKKLLNAITECMSHIQIVLKYGTGMVPLDDIKVYVSKLMHKEQGRSVAEQEKTAEELYIMMSRIDNLKETILKLIHKTVVEYVDESLVEAVKSIFDKTFITEKQEIFIFDISGLEEQNKITICINDEPVHKYFNTFRYRLFCLTLQAVLNIKLMKNESFLFPFILDDVFYANDYRNKRELFKYFEQIRKYAKETLGDSQKLQIIFFTHDEQIVSCFSTKFLSNDDDQTAFVRLAQPNFAEHFECKEITQNGNKEKYYNLYFKLYE